VSFEFFPPKTAAGEAKLRQAALQLAEFEPDFVSVTFGAGGSSNVKTLETCVSLRETMGLEVIPHISCIGRTPEEIEEHLERYREAGFGKLLALRGDVPIDAEASGAPLVTDGGFRYASELVAFIKNRGGFHILVGCYPEGHPEAPSMQHDVENFVRKVEAGAEVAITQYFFNNAAYFHFVHEVRRRGVDIPIVVGLMPSAPYAQVLRFSEKCGADLPLWIRKRMEGYQDDPVSQVDFAIDVATQQVEELLHNGAPGIHFYTLNHPEATMRICERLRPNPPELGEPWGDALAPDEIDIPSSLS